MSTLPWDLGLVSIENHRESDLSPGFSGCVIKHLKINSAQGLDELIRKTIEK